MLNPTALDRALAKVHEAKGSSFVEMTSEELDALRDFYKTKIPAPPWSVETQIHEREMRMRCLELAVSSPETFGVSTTMYEDAGRLLHYVMTGSAPS